MNGRERRQHKRVNVDFWASLTHPLLGVVTGAVQDMSNGGVSMMLDGEMNLFIMMELDVRIHGEGWDETMPSLPVQVTRIQQREVGLRFLDVEEDFWPGAPVEDENYDDLKDVMEKFEEPV
jgi:hypothetical protein